VLVALSATTKPDAMSPLVNRLDIVGLGIVEEYGLAELANWLDVVVTPSSFVGGLAVVV
jgi:hypothetical protein